MLEVVSQIGVVERRVIGDREAGTKVIDGPRSQVQKQIGEAPEDDGIEAFR
jgi:hypothetical protein